MFQNQRGKARQYVKRVALVAALILILWIGGGIMRPLESAAVSFSGILFGVGSYAANALSSIRVFFANKQGIVDENKKLADALESARVHILLYEEVKKENEELKEFMGRDTSLARGVLGRVLSRPNNSPYDIFLIDIGKDKGIAAGSLVIRGEVLLGVVDTVYPHSAKVRLFSSPDYELPVVLGSKNIPATARGLGGGMFEIKIPSGVAVAEGDVITYPSIRANLLGTVVLVDTKPADSFQRILFRAPLNIFTTQFILVTDEMILLSIEERL